MFYLTKEPLIDTHAQQPPYFPLPLLPSPTLGWACRSARRTRAVVIKRTHTHTHAGRSACAAPDVHFEINLLPSARHNPRRIYYSLQYITSHSLNVTALCWRRGGEEAVVEESAVPQKIKNKTVRWGEVGQEKEERNKARGDLGRLHGTAVEKMKDALGWREAGGETCYD